MREDPFTSTTPAWALRGMLLRPSSCLWYVPPTLLHWQYITYELSRRPLQSITRLDLWQPSLHILPSFGYLHSNIYLSLFLSSQLLSWWLHQVASPFTVHHVDDNCRRNSNLCGDEENVEVVYVIVIRGEIVFNAHEGEAFSSHSNKMKITHNSLFSLLTHLQWVSHI